MSFMIEAFAGTGETMARLRTALSRGRVVSRPGGYAIIPWELSGAERLNAGKPGCIGLYSSHLSRLSAEAAEAARQVSGTGVVAYFECVSHPGAFRQASVVWHGGEVVLEPGVENDRINQALRLIGVPRVEGRDEFDTLRLGEHRDTGDW